MSVWKRLFGQQETIHTSIPDQHGAPSTGVDRDRPVDALTQEQQEALWLNPIALAGLSSGTAAAITFGTSGATEHKVSPEVAKWAKPIVDSIQGADALSRNNRYKEAIETYEQLLEKAPDAAIVLMSIGCCYANMGDKKNAKHWLGRASSVAPSNERIRRNLSALDSL